VAFYVAPMRGIYDGGVMPPPFQSYTQNAEDVVLWRALRGVDHGRYIDVGANDPCNDSLTIAFYQRGWTGITVEPDPHFAAMQRERRPGDIVVEAAITEADGGTVILHVVDDTGLSTLDDERARLHALSRQTHDVAVPTRRLDSVLQDAGWAGQDIHFMTVDTEGSERMVLETVDLSKWRPWILVVEATEPNTTRSTRRDWEDVVLGAGYRFCLFDGLSCFYVSEERSQQLAGALSYPACVLDNYMPPALRHCEERARRAREVAHEQAHEIQSLVVEVVRWRAEAISRWATAMGGGAEDMGTGPIHVPAELQAARLQKQMLDQEVEALRYRVADLETSTSWRVTKPMRAASGLIDRVRGRRSNE
jgi:FkbM family methyltransferase